MILQPIFGHHGRPIEPETKLGLASHIGVSRERAAAGPPATPHGLMWTWSNSTSAIPPLRLCGRRAPMPCPGGLPGLSPSPIG
jgi:hypothetical protein